MWWEIRKPNILLFYIQCEFMNSEWGGKSKGKYMRYDRESVLTWNEFLNILFFSENEYFLFSYVLDSSSCLICLLYKPYKTSKSYTSRVAVNMVQLHWSLVSAAKCSQTAAKYHCMCRSTL